MYRADRKIQVLLCTYIEGLFVRNDWNFMSIIQRFGTFLETILNKVQSDLHSEPVALFFDSKRPLPSGA